MTTDVLLDIVRMAEIELNPDAAEDEASEHFSSPKAIRIRAVETHLRNLPETEDVDADRALAGTLYLFLTGVYPARMLESHLRTYETAHKNR